VLHARKRDAAVFVTRAAASNARAYRGPYSISKAALDVLVRTYAAETASTPVRVNLFNRARPGPACARLSCRAKIRRRCRARSSGGEDRRAVLPSFQDTGKILRLSIKQLWNFGRRLETRGASRRKSPA